MPNVTMWSLDSLISLHFVSSPLVWSRISDCVITRYNVIVAAFYACRDCCPKCGDQGGGSKKWRVRVKRYVITMYYNDLRSSRCRGTIECGRLYVHIKIYLILNQQNFLSIHSILRLNFWTSNNWILSSHFGKRKEERENGETMIKQGY